MNTQAQVQIYLAGQRGHSESGNHQSDYTFNYGVYSAEGREPFGALYLVNDERLTAKSSLSWQIDEPTEVVLLPVKGELDYSFNDLVTSLVPGQAGILSLVAGVSYSVTNPYPSESINFIQFWLKKPLNDFSAVASQTGFDLTQQNTLLPLFGESDPEGATGYQGFIGRYSGRQNGVYFVRPFMSGQKRRIFVFILQGAFEVANRLLHEKDGLALEFEQSGELEFEALSNDALLILIDLLRE
ncbi:pirin family protein [Spirosoma pollinicola]|uniref:Pirin n=1 Tax=Spirosoma pollinicola TaxID=2057025 RepID=A0A2K8Z7T8_9BACT|nr:pirin [Spirosoma pollinicola]AUD05932.1 pirin [Spirosoma pollinicola]